MGAESFIPINLKGLESWGRWLALQKMQIQKDIDQVWYRYGLHEYVPPPYNLYIVLALCCLPFMLVFSLLCCIIDEEEPKPQYAAKQAPKKSVRPEKLD